MASEAETMAAHLQLEKIIADMEPADPYRDQLRAATEAANALMDHRGAPVQESAAPGWARLGALTAMVKWGQGEDTRVCQHEPSHLRPQPVFAAAWKPGHVTCELCAPMLWVPSANYHCDCCDAVGEQACSPGTMQIAALTWAFFICQRCRDGLDPLTPDADDR